MKTKDIRVSEELIMKYKPCRHGLDNFRKHYKDISIKELINSKNISYDDKIWLLKKIVSSELLVLWAVDSSFAAYEHSAISNNVANASEAAYAAGNAAHAAFEADYAEAAAYYAVGSAYFKDKDNSQKERLQSLLYFIEGA